MNQPYKIFIIYAHQDEVSRHEIATHLVPMERAKQVLVWADHKIMPGEEWEPAIKTQLGKAHLILLLVSPDFFASKYIHEVEIKEALARHKRNEARIIPIVVRPCDWKSDPLISQMQLLPTKAVPINDIRHWTTRDFAWDDVVEGIKLALQQLKSAEMEVIRKREEEGKRLQREIERAEAERKRQAEEKRRQQEMELAKREAEEKRQLKERARAEADRKRRKAEQQRQVELKRIETERLRQEEERKRKKEMEEAQKRQEEEKAWAEVLKYKSVTGYKVYINSYRGIRTEEDLLKVRRLIVEDQNGFPLWFIIFLFFLFLPLILALPSIVNSKGSIGGKIFLIVFMILGLVGLFILLLNSLWQRNFIKTGRSFLKFYE
ncbi:MAG: TIR domain-containing protein [Saprospiraceae bacterium]